MNWIILLCAGLCEVAFTFCMGKLKGASGAEFYLWGAGFVVAVPVSMGLLARAVQTIPIGTGYAVWTGIGAVARCCWAYWCFASQPPRPVCSSWVRSLPPLWA